MFVKIWNRLINWGFQFLYHQFAFMYDWVAALVSGGRWKEWVLTSSQYINDEPILEIGFGTGHLQQQFLLKGKKIIGLDESRFMCSLVTKRLKKMNKTGAPAGLCRGIAQSLPFANNSFSTIVMTFPTQYALDERTIRECWRVLRSQGKIVVLLAVSHGGRSLYVRFIRWLFDITDQTPDAPNIQAIWKKRYSAAGFRMNQEWQQFGEDCLWFLLAEKESTPFANG